MIYRIYLKELTGWREFGIDYPTREAANAVADQYRSDFPRHTYIVRGGNFRRLSQFVPSDEWMEA